MGTRLTTDSWTVLAPMVSLILDDAVDFEFRIDRVTFIATERLARRRRRLGIPMRISEMRDQRHGVLKRFLGQSPTMAVIRARGKMSKLDREIVRTIRDELAILACSQLGYVKRTETSAPSIWAERPITKHSFLWCGQSRQWAQPNRIFGPFRTLLIDKDWLKFQKDIFFIDLLRLIQGKIRIDAPWRNELRRASILIGHSQMSSSLPDAFLFNMIALELLLTRPNDKRRDALPSRAEALLGWSTHWSHSGFEEKIRSAYKLRCRIVHEGDRDSVQPRDLYFTDDLLFCLLANLVRHPKLFASKDAVVQFSQRVEAERVLGARPKVRPQSLRFPHRTYRPSDFDIY